METEVHSLGMQGIRNARQLGGYETPEGKKIRPGVLLRTGRLNAGTKEDLDRLLEDYQLGTVIDLRVKVEIDREPDPALPGVDYRWINLLEEEATDDTSFRSIVGIYGKDRIQLVMDMAQGVAIHDTMYAEIAEGEAGIAGMKEIFRLLLENEQRKGILWHCSGGKDRTGLTAVMILAALGIPKEVALEDFDLSNAYLAAWISDLQGEVAKRTSDRRIIRRSGYIAGVSKGYMERGVEKLVEDYGSVRRYLEEEIGLSKEDFKTMERLYLTE